MTFGLIETLLNYRKSSSKNCPLILMPLSTENVNLLGFLDRKAGFFFFSDMVKPLSVNTLKVDQGKHI